MIIEVKRPGIKDENSIADGESSTPFQQMQSYCRLKQPQIGVIANGDNLLKFYEAPAFDEALVIDKFPANGENIAEWKENRRFTFKQLMQADRLQTETLKDIILDVEQRFGANDSSDKAFEEIFKLTVLKIAISFYSSEKYTRLNNYIFNPFNACIVKLTSSINKWAFKKDYGVFRNPL